VRGKPRVLIIGLDGVGFELLERMAADGLAPNIAAIAARGFMCRLETTRPPTTFPAWTSFLTGAIPSRHGLPDFTIRSGYRVRFAGAADRRLPTVLSHLERRGATVGAAWFPATYPPEPLSGYQISGWDSPVTAAGDPSFVHPADLHADLEAAFGADHVAFDTLDEMRSDPGWYLEAAEALPRRAARRAEIAAWLLERRPVDVAAFWLGEADTASHHFWAFHDPGSPRRPDSFAPGLSRVLTDVYRALDEAVGCIVEAAGEDASIALISDHGSGGSSDVALHPNRMLRDAGLLELSRGVLPRLDAGTARGILPGLVPPRLRRAAFRAAGGIAPALIESRLRFGGIDWSRTRAFSDELAYAPAVWINQLGREPRGTVRARDREAVAREVERAALALRSPDGEPIVRRVVRREEIHTGRWRHLFPDLLLELADQGGYTPACVPSGARPGPSVTRLSGDALLGRKGRSLPGCHTPDAMLCAAGPSAPSAPRAGAAIHDAAALATAMAGVAPAPWFDGSWPPAGGARSGERKDDARAPGGSERRGYTAAEERVVAARLKRLGYLEG